MGTEPESVRLRDAARPNARAGLAWAFFGSLMSACFLIPWKEATAYGDPRIATLVLLFCSALLNSAASWMPQLRVGDEGERPLGPTLRLAVAFAVLSLIGNWCSAEAVSRVSGPLLAVLQRCEVFVVGLLSATLLREPVRAPFWIGTVLATAGLFVLQRPETGSPAFEPLGVLFGMGSAASFGTMIALTRKYIGVVRPVLLNAIRLWLSVLLWLVLARRVPSASELSPALWLYVGLAAFFGPFLSRLGAIFSARHVAASTTALMSLATPAMTLALAFLVSGTLPTGRELLGGGIVLLGIAIPLAASARHG